MNNKTIWKCKNCGDMYCGECSTHQQYFEFCSDECAKEWHEAEQEDKRVAKPVKG